MQVCGTFDPRCYIQTGQGSRKESKTESKVPSNLLINVLMSVRMRMLISNMIFTY